MTRLGTILTAAVVVSGSIAVQSAAAQARPDRPVRDAGTTQATPPAPGQAAAQPAGPAGAPAGAGPLAQPAPQPVLQGPGLDPIGQVAPAKAAGAAALTRLNNTRDEMLELVRDQRLLFETSAEYRAAVAEQRAAVTEWTRARNEVIASLEHDGEYTEGRKLRERLGHEIDAERARPGGGRRDEIQGRADLRMTLGQRLSAREAEALAADGNVATAKRRLDDVARRIEDLRRDFYVKLRTGESLAAARKNVRDASEGYAYAATYARQAARTADIVLDYAYYVQYLSTLRPYVISSPVLGYYGTNPYGTSFLGAAPGGSGIGFGLMPGQ